MIFTFRLEEEGFFEFHIWKLLKHLTTLRLTGVRIVVHLATNERRASKPRVARIGEARPS